MRPRRTHREAPQPRASTPPAKPRKFEAAREDDGALAELDRALDQGRPCGAAPARSVARAKQILDADGNLTAAVVDVRLEDGTGFDVAEHARSLYPLFPVLLMTGYDTNEMVNAVFDLHVEIVTKPCGPRIERFLRDVILGKQKGPRALRIEYVVDARARAHGLTEAEAQILLAAALGKSRRDIAAERNGKAWKISTPGDRGLRD